MLPLSKQTFANQGRWAIAIKQPMRGALALLHTARQGFEYFNPQMQDNKQNTNQDLFPGYFFVDMHSAAGQFNNRWRALMNTIGIAGVVMGTKNEPGLVAHSAIERIRGVCNADGIYICPPKPRFKTGQQVRVASANGKHSFEDHLGIYEGMLPKDRCKVLFGLVPANIAEGDLIAA